MKLGTLEKADQVDSQGESVSKTFMSAVASSKIGRETELFEQLNLKLQHLSAEQKFQLTKLITWHRDAFVLNLQELGIGVRPICQHNSGNNRMLKEPRIMLE